MKTKKIILTFLLISGGNIGLIKAMPEADLELSDNVQNTYSSKGKERQTNEPDAGGSEMDTLDRLGELKKKILNLNVRLNACVESEKFEVDFKIYKQCKEDFEEYQESLQEFMMYRLKQNHHLTEQATYILDECVSQISRADKLLAKYYSQISNVSKNQNLSGSSNPNRNKEDQFKDILDNISGQNFLDNLVHEMMDDGLKKIEEEIIRLEILIKTRTNLETCEKDLETCEEQLQKFQTFHSEANHLTKDIKCRVDECFNRIKLLEPLLKGDKENPVGGSNPAPVGGSNPAPVGGSNPAPGNSNFGTSELVWSLSSSPSSSVSPIPTTSSKQNTKEENKEKSYESTNITKAVEKEDGQKFREDMSDPNTTKEVSFSDIAKVTWAHKAIQRLVEKNILSGTEFKPHTNITRADFIGWLVQAMDLTADSANQFEDVNESHVYAKEISIAKELGLAKGYQNNFSPDQTLTREDMMVLIERAITLSEKKLDDQKADLSQFEDHKTVSTYAINSISKLVKNGIVQGNGINLDPKKMTTRAEAAVIIVRLLDL